MVRIMDSGDWAVLHSIENRLERLERRAGEFDGPQHSLAPPPARRTLSEHEFWGWKLVSWRDILGSKRTAPWRGHGIKFAGKNKGFQMASDRQNLQDAFLNHTRKTKIPVTVFLVNGVKLQGVITWFDNFCVLLRRDGQSQLVYKHAISTIMPAQPINLYDGDESN